MLDLNQLRQKLPKIGLLAPLGLFLAVFFVLPIVLFLSLGMRDAEVPAAFPKTIEVLKQAQWQANQPVPLRVYNAFAQDLVAARQAGTLADAARRLNYAVNGVRSTLMSAARQASQLPQPLQVDEAFFKSIEPKLASPELFSAIMQASGQLTDFYLLSATDLQRSATGDVQAAPADQRIYMDVLQRTVSISLTVTLFCLLLGFPVAVLLTQVKGKLADWLMVLVLLPFWTSLIVRTTAWVILLQKEGLVNSGLMQLGLIAEPLTLIYNRTGVVIAMTHVLLPFMILPLYGVLSKMPPQYMRAAASLGAPPWVAFFRVYIPLAMPGILSGSIMVFIMALGYYITPVLIGGGSNQMLSYFIAFYTTDTGNWGLAAALGLMLMIVTVVLYSVAQYLAQKLSGARVKEAS